MFALPATVSLVSIGLAEPYPVAVRLSAITPLEIKQQEFKRVMRGYDSVEVDTFLDMVGAEFEKILNDVKDYEKKVIALEADLINFKEV